MTPRCLKVRVNVGIQKIVYSFLKPAVPLSMEKTPEASICCHIAQLPKASTAPAAVTCSYNTNGLLQPEKLAGRKVCYPALFTNLVGWHAGAVTFPLNDVILAQLACP